MLRSADPLVARLNSVFEQKTPAFLASIDRYRKRVDELKSELRELGADRSSAESDVWAAQKQPSSEADRVDAAERLPLDIARIEQEEEIDSVLKKHLLEPVGGPYPVTLDELRELADSHIFVMESGLSEIDEFRRAVIARVTEFRWSHGVVVGRVDRNPKIDKSFAPLWSNDWLQITVRQRIGRRRLPFRHMGLRWHPERRVYASLSGWISKDAAEGAHRVLGRVVRAALRAVSDLEGRGEGAEEPLALVSRDGLTASRIFLRRFIGTYWAPRPRIYADVGIYNAVRLLIEAASQQNHAIALSLYCSAMEALLGRGRGDITKSVSEDVATLLEFTPQARPDAVGFVRGVYDIRSRTLHGDSIETDPTSRARTRALATDVLRAVIERRDFEAKLGTRPKSSQEDSLLKELESARLTGQQIVGITPSRVCWLWSEGSGRK